MQAIAAVASLRARDGAAVAAHTAWGSFWMGWGILQLLVATHVMAPIPLGAAGAMVLEHSFGRSIIPVGKWSKRANIPGAKVTDPIAYPVGMPGVRVGQ
jgi:hypothetical protein